ncbi:UNVERIFIED_CONTAM: hypothetical protein O8I53_09185 [Campylobacter lari]
MRQDQLQFAAKRLRFVFLCCFFKKSKIYIIKKEVFFRILPAKHNLRKEVTIKLYNRINYKTRCQIEMCIKENLSFSKISEMLNLSKSTISQEISLNSGFYGYIADEAHQKYLTIKNEMISLN